MFALSAAAARVPAFEGELRTGIALAMGQSAVRGKRLKRADQIVAVADQLLGDEGVPLEELMAALKARGIHGADSSEVWVILTERGVAEMSGGRFVRKGVATQSSGHTLSRGAPQDAPTRVGGEVVARASGVPGVPQPPMRRAGLHAEVRRLRGSLQIAPLREETRATPVPPGWPARARELAEAVRQELKESAARLNLQDVPVSDGERLVVTESRVLYRFDVQGELPSGEGATVTFLPDGAEAGDQYEAEIVSVFGSEVTLALPTEAPAVRSGRLRCDLTWLLISQRERLREVEGGIAGFNAEAALSLTQVDRSTGRDLSEVEPIHGLNDQQSRAVAQARRFGTTWLWGPPGTGKTTTVAAIVEKLVVEDQCRVLLVAPTNVAVDVAVGAVLRRIPARDPGLVARLGPPVHGDLFDHADGRVLVDEIAADRGSEVADRRVAVGQEIAALRSSLRALRAADRRDAVSRREVEAELADKQALARDLDGLLRELRRQVCRDAGLVAATTHQVLLGTLKGLPFDAVIIDEGSMVPTSLAALVAGSGCGHTIVAGDFHQLPPVTQSEAPEVLRWLRRSPFESCGVEKAVRSGEAVTGLAPLREQHRMRAAVSDMVSAAFYPDSPLVTADSVLRRAEISSSASWPTEPVVLIDTSDLRSRVSRRQGQWSRLNIAHAQIAAGIAERVATDGSDLAFISPFSPQAKLLGAFAGPQTRASTVHRYQGSEAQSVSSTPSTRRPRSASSTRGSPRVSWAVTAPAWSTSQRAAPRNSSCFWRTWAGCCGREVASTRFRGSFVRSTGKVFPSPGER